MELGEVLESGLNSVYVLNRVHIDLMHGEHERRVPIHSGLADLQDLGICTCSYNMPVDSNNLADHRVDVPTFASHQENVGPSLNLDER